MRPQPIPCPSSVVANLVAAASAAIAIAIVIATATAQDTPPPAITAGAIAGIRIAVLLDRLGAKMEHGVGSDQLDSYRRQFHRLDSNGDGKHSKSEFIEQGTYLTPQARRGIFAAADANQDGSVTQAEYTLNRIITDEAKEIVQAMDDDTDGTVQRSEFITHASPKLADTEAAAHVFAALDTNGDGEIVVPEYLRVWGQLARMSGQPAAERLAAAAATPDATSTSGVADEPDGDTTRRLAELDAYWAKVSRAVRKGDFEGYKATCHADGVLVSGASRSSYPLSKALARWQEGFIKTAAGSINADVSFRFSQRLGDPTTAHETGIFRYSTTDADGTTKTDYIHFEALLTKRTEWRILMEYQKSAATLVEWNALK